ncbi:MAG: hypothetical protein AAF533_16050 [Acidobacteriota bacterium]
MISTLVLLATLAVGGDVELGGTVEPPPETPFRVVLQTGRRLDVVEHVEENGMVRLVLGERRRISLPRHLIKRIENSDGTPLAGLATAATAQGGGYRLVNGLPIANAPGSRPPKIALDLPDLHLDPATAPTGKRRIGIGAGRTAASPRTAPSLYSVLRGQARLDTPREGASGEAPPPPPPVTPVMGTPPRPGRP